MTASRSSSVIVFCASHSEMTRRYTWSSSRRVSVCPTPLAAVLHGVAARMLAEHQRRLRHADVGGAHDLVGAAILQHAVLMNPRFMREGVAADDGFVRCTCWPVSAVRSWLVGKICSDLMPVVNGSGPV